MQVDTAEMHRPYARKTRFVTARHLDRRTVAARKAKALVAQFTAAAGTDLSDGQRMAIERAAALVACAENARVRCLGGDPGMSINDVVRIERLATQAVRDLDLDGRKRGPAGPSFGEVLRREREARQQR